MAPTFGSRCSACDEGGFGQRNRAAAQAIEVRAGTASTGSLRHRNDHRRGPNRLRACLLRFSAILPWVKTVSVYRNSPISAAPDGADEDARVAAVARLHDLFGRGRLSVERLSGTLEKVFAASSHADLEAALLGLPSLVSLTPAARRLTKPLVLRAPDGDLRLGCWLAVGGRHDDRHGLRGQPGSISPRPAGTTNRSTFAWRPGARSRFSSQPEWPCRCSADRRASTSSGCLRRSPAVRCCGSPHTGRPA